MNRFQQITCAAATAVLLCAAIPAAGQVPGAERTYAHSQAEVEKALAQIRPTAKGRLPTMEGFVEATEQPLEHYTNGYYDCTIKVSQASTGGTVVRVTAKVTAWYSDANPAKSGYRTLTSNGRVETDLLDRLGEVLDPGKPQSANGGAAGDGGLGTGGTVPSGAFRSANSELPDAPTPYVPGATPLPAVGGVGTKADPSAGGNPAGAPDPTEAERARAEQHANEMSNLAQNLEDILRNQARPDNLAAVRKSGTAVYARPEARSHVLFSAEAQDEFQILDVQPEWVHVQISGASRGWIRRGDLELPEGFVQPSAAGGGNSEKSEVTFHVSRETVTRFPGDWEPLRGKMVKVYDVEPTAGMATSAKAKLAFTKSLLTSTKPDSTPGAGAAAGVVVVFDSSDGGQISATAGDLEQFRGGRISEETFWRQCKLDPPEAFQETKKP